MWATDQPTAASSIISDIPSSNDVLTTLLHDYIQLKTQFNTICKKYDSFDHSLQLIQGFANNAVNNVNKHSNNSNTSDTDITNTIIQSIHTLRQELYKNHNSDQQRYDDVSGTSNNSHTTTTDQNNLSVLSTNTIGSHTHVNNSSNTTAKQHKSTPFGILSCLQQPTGSTEQILEQLTDRLAYKHFEYKTQVDTVQYRVAHTVDPNSTLAGSSDEFVDDNGDAIDEWMNSRTGTNNIWNTKLGLATTNNNNTIHNKSPVLRSNVDTSSPLTHSKFIQLSSINDLSLMESSNDQHHNTITIDQQHSDKTVTDVDVLHRICTNQYLLSRIDEVIESIQPTQESEKRYAAVYQYIVQLVKRSVIGDIACHGSYALKTYLPDADLDLTLFMQAGDESDWANKIINTLLNLCHHSSNAHNDNKNNKSITSNISSISLSSSSMQVKSVTYVNGDVKLIKTQIGNYSIDISINQIGALSSCALFEYVDVLIAQSHLFKRSCILIKTYFQHELNIIGSHKGLLSSYAVRTMALYIFNVYHKLIHHPIQALTQLLWYLTQFDFTRYALSIYGPVELSSLPQLNYVTRNVCSYPIDCAPLLSTDILHHYTQQSITPKRGNSNISPNTTTIWKQHYMNILDTLNTSNNLGRSVSNDYVQFIQQSVHDGYIKLVHSLQQIQLQCTAIDITEQLSDVDCTVHSYTIISALFTHTLHRYANYNDLFMRGRRSVKVKQRQLANGIHVPLTPLSSNTAINDSTTHNNIIDPLDGQLPKIQSIIKLARSYESPEMSELDIIHGMCELLQYHHTLPVGKLGSLLHQKLNNHQLPAILKERYGGLKKFIERCNHIFVLLNDHAFNPSVTLNQNYITSINSQQQLPYES